jgi:hypothetical protein
MLIGYCMCDRQVWLCGEVVTVALKDRFNQLFPHIQLLNLYSISECHDVTCSGKLVIIKCYSFRSNCVIECIMTSSLVQVLPIGQPSPLKHPSVPGVPGCETQFLTALLLEI